MRISPWAGVVVVMTAGCTSAPGDDSGAGRAAERLRLADLVCDLVYADGTPVDCETGDGAVAEVAPTSGWFCVDTSIGSSRASPANYNFWLWTDLQGHYGIEYLVGFESGIVGEALLLEDGEEVEDIDFMGAQGGFLRFERDVADRMNYVLNLSTWDAQGQPEVMTTEHLAAHITRGGDPPFVVLRFGLGDDAYYLRGLMDTSLGLEGEDFDVFIRYTNQVGAGEMTNQLAVTRAANPTTCD